LQITETRQRTHDKCRKWPKGDCGKDKWQEGNRSFRIPSHGDALPLSYRSQRGQPCHDPEGGEWASLRKKDEPSRNRSQPESPSPHVNRQVFLA
jgi:hypothetical protein